MLHTVVPACPLLKPLPSAVTPCLRGWLSLPVTLTFSLPSDSANSSLALFATLCCFVEFSAAAQSRFHFSYMLLAQKREKSESAHL